MLSPHKSNSLCFIRYTNKMIYISNVGWFTIQIGRTPSRNGIYFTLSFIAGDFNDDFHNPLLKDMISLLTNPIRASCQVNGQMFRIRSKSENTWIKISIANSIDLDEETLGSSFMYYACFNCVHFFSRCKHSTHRTLLMNCEHLYRKIHNASFGR